MNNEFNENMKICKVCDKQIAKSAKKCPNCGKDQRNFFMRHKFFTGFLVLIILSAIGSDSSDKKNISGSKDEIIQENKQEKSVKNNIENVEEIEEIIEISAKKLADDYDENEVRADDLYKNKTLRISGVVNSIDVMFERTFIVLDGGGEFGFINIQCYFKDENEIEKLKELDKGDSVTLLGKVEGKSLNVIVKDCLLE